MAALKERGFPVPTAVAHNRHAVVMTLLDGCPLNQVPPVPPLVFHPALSQCPSYAPLPSFLSVVPLRRSCVSDTASLPGRSMSILRWHLPLLTTARSPPFFPTLPFLPHSSLASFFTHPALSQLQF